MRLSPRACVAAAVVTVAVLGLSGCGKDGELPGLSGKVVTTTTTSTPPAGDS
jgi:hypothetical protein